MGQITTGIGLISGINTADLIEQLVALESRPKALVENQNAVLTSQQVAFQAINANLLALKGSASGFLVNNLFGSTTSTSSDESVLNVTSNNFTQPGTYNFVVDRLVSTQQLITNGFADTEASPFASGGGTLTFEFGRAQLQTDSELSNLNGGDGVKRGKIQITDRSGANQIVDLSRALTANDVLDAINNTSGINVTASVSGDSFVITDNTGSTAAALTVAEVADGTTATELGLLTDLDADPGSITGATINRLGDDTILAFLNDSNGIRFDATQDDFQIDYDSGSFTVNLAGITTLEDVFDTIETASGGDVTASVNASGTGILLTDNTSGTSTVTVTDLNGSKAAEDLGILGTGTSGQLSGTRIVAALNSVLLKNVNGGSGITEGAAGQPIALTGSTLIAELFNGTGLRTNDDPGDYDFDIRDRTGQIHDIEVDDLNTIQELIDRVDTVTSGAVTMSIEGQALRVTDNTGSTSDKFRIRDRNGSKAAEDLGIEIDANVTTVLGVDTEPVSSSSTTQFQITNRAGTTTTIDISTAESVSDIIDAINESGAGVVASLNDAENGLLLTDTTGSTVSDLAVADVNGAAAADLGLVQSVSEDSINSGNVNLKYVSEGTLLSSLNGGRGIASGQFRITDSSGASATVDLSQGNETTIQDVIDEINSRGLAINARVNDTGDGILIEDTGPGAVAIKVEESGSSTAQDLGLLGEATAPGSDLNGSFETTIEVTATDTLQDVVTKINDSGLRLNASIINDGSPVNPFRLSLVSEDGGKAGTFVFDDGGLDLGTTKLTEARDAVVFYGSPDPASGIAITSTSNTLSGVIPSATIDLVGTSDDLVTVTINRDNSAITTAVQTFVENFNTAIDTIDQYDFFDSESEERGLLFADPTVQRVRSSLYRIIINRNTEISSQFNALSQIGVTVGAESKLEFDSSKFQDALLNDPDAVEALFTFKETETDPDTNEVSITAAGIGVRIDELLDNLTKSDGSVQSKIGLIEDQIELNKNRIEDLEEGLDRKRAKLQAEFTAMEVALARFQGQSQALANLQLLASQSSSVLPGL